MREWKKLNKWKKKINQIFERHVTNGDELQGVHKEASTFLSTLINGETYEFCREILVLVFFTFRAQFYQPFGTKRKCIGTQLLAQKMPLGFTNRIAPNSNSAQQN